MRSNGSPSSPCCTQSHFLFLLFIAQICVIYISYLIYYALAEAECEVLHDATTSWDSICADTII